MKIFLNILAISLILGLTSCMFNFEQGENTTFQKEFNLKPGGNLLVNTSGGSIKVSGDENLTKAVVDVTIRSNKSGKNLTESQIEELLNDLDIKMELSGNLLTLEYKTHGSGVFLWGMNPSVSFSVKVPAQTLADLKTSGGSVQISGLNGDQSLRTSGGSIRIENVKGGVDAKTSGGSIRYSQSKGHASLNTSGGSITLENSQGTITAKTSGGGIRLSDVGGNIDARTSGGSIKAQNLFDITGLALKTSGGSITVDLQADKAYAIVAKGSSVKLNRTDNFNGQISKDRVNGSWNKGSVDVSLSTSAGSVKVNFLD